MKPENDNDYSLCRADMCASKIIADANNNNDNGVLYDVTIKDEYLTHKQVIIISSYIENSTDLFAITDPSEEIKLPYRCIGPNRHNLIQLYIQIAKSLKYIHDLNFIHLDIKPENILVDINNFRSILIDYGLSCVINDIPEKYKGCLIPCSSRNEFFGGTVSYISPEVVFNGIGKRNLSAYIRRYKLNPDLYVISPKSDIYSFGIMMYACYFGNDPVPDYNYNNSQYLLFKLNPNNSFEPVYTHEYNDAHIKKALYDLVKRMTHTYPQNRISIDEVMQGLTDIYTEVCKTFRCVYDNKIDICKYE